MYWRTFTGRGWRALLAGMAKTKLPVQPPYGDPAWFTEDLRVLFLHEIQNNGGNVKEALNTVQVSPLVALRAYKADPKFKAEWDESLEAATMVLESHAVKRATTGATRQVLDNQGNLVDIEDRPSDKLLETMLKARKPDLYSDKVRVTGADGGPVQVRDALIEKILDMAASRGKKTDGES